MDVFIKEAKIEIDSVWVPITYRTLTPYKTLSFKNDCAANGITFSGVNLLTTD